MPSAIDPLIKKQVINQWLSGDSRDRIAADNNIGAGTVTNIISEWKKGVEDSDYDSVRELAIYSKKQGFGLIQIASSIRLGNYFQKLGVLAQSIHSNVIIAPTSNQTLPTIVYNCITHCSSQQNAFMDGYKLGAIHATSGHFYDNNCNKDTLHYCSVYQAGYATGWDRYIWAAKHTCYHCVNI